MEKIKPILIYWQPKDIPEVLEEFEKIKGIDKYVIRYYGYPNPHRLLQEFFDSHKEYDWFILMTNDIVVKQENIDKILKDIESGKFKVIAGVMNLDMEENKDKWAFCIEDPNKGYKWVEKGSVLGYVEARFIGGSLWAIHQSLFREFNWYIPNYINYGVDLRFATWCMERKIPMYVNTDNEMLHLRFVGESMIGIKEPNVELIKQ